jgi:hypothetical protein
LLGHRSHLDRFGWRRRRALRSVLLLLLMMMILVVTVVRVGPRRRHDRDIRRRLITLLLRWHTIQMRLTTSTASNDSGCGGTISTQGWGGRSGRSDLQCPPPLL